MGPGACFSRVLAPSGPRQGVRGSQVHVAVSQRVARAAGGVRAHWPRVCGRSGARGPDWFPCRLETSGGALRSRRGKPPRPPWHSSPCPDPGALPLPKRPEEAPCGPGASNVAVPLRQSNAAALHFPPQPLRPASGRQEAASTGKKEPGHHAPAHPAPPRAPRAPPQLRQHLARTPYVSWHCEPPSGPPGLARPTPPPAALGTAPLAPPGPRCPGSRPWAARARSRPWRGEPTATVCPERCPGPRLQLRGAHRPPLEMSP